MNAEPVSSELRAGEREENSRALGMETRFCSEGWLLGVCVRVCVVVELFLLAKVSSLGFCPPHPAWLGRSCLRVPWLVPASRWISAVGFTLLAVRGVGGRQRNE